MAEDNKILMDILEDKDKHGLETLTGTYWKL